MGGGFFRALMIACNSLFCRFRLSTVVVKLVFSMSQSRVASVSSWVFWVSSCSSMPTRFVSCTTSVLTVFLSPRNSLYNSLPTSLVMRVVSFLSLMLPKRLTRSPTVPEMMPVVKPVCARLFSWREVVILS